MTTTWTFIGEFDGTTETWANTTCDATRLPATYIEEQLYVLWELTPAIRDWERHMANANGAAYTIFRYGAIEMFTVRINSKARTVLVQAI